MTGMWIEEGRWEDRRAGKSLAGGELDARVGLGAELGIKAGEIEAQSVGWTGHVWWSDRGVSSTEFRGGGISIKLGVNPGGQ